MIIPDINLLVYAYNDQAPWHTEARLWWEACINGKAPIGMPWVVASGFVRLMTHPSILEKPMAPGAAVGHVRAWLEQPPVRILQPGARFAELFFRYLEELGTGGNLTTDAQIAALAVEYQAVLYSNDADYARFAGLRWNNPLKR